MKNMLTPGYIGNFIIHLFMFILLISVYTYIQKLEKSGCMVECDVKYPYVKFIKQFSIFALGFILFVMLVPPGTILADIFGPKITTVYTFVIVMFYLVFGLYLWMTMTYTRLLITEKCKCSEDIRRELIFAGATIEMILLVLVILTVIIIPIILSTITIFFDNIGDVSSKIQSNLKNPAKGIKEVPKNALGVLKGVKSIARKSLKGVKKLSKK
jgi:hypothetical protein